MVEDKAETRAGEVFGFSEDGNGLARFELKFTADDVCSDGKRERSFVLPADYAGLPALAQSLKGKHVQISGHGAVETYFALAYYAVLNGADAVECVAVDGQVTELFQRRDCLPADKAWLSLSSDTEDRVEVLCAPGADGKWTAEELALSVPALIPGGTSPIVFTGRGSVMMYASLGVSAALAKRRDVRIEKPMLPYSLRFTPEVAGECVVRRGGRSGVVVGILGDPNSGKSVFSHALCNCIRRIMPVWHKSWIYDCDLASPTPDWYLSARSSGADAGNAYSEARDRIKAHWNSSLEDKVAEDLHVLGGSLDLVVADMPGGLHPKKGGESFEPRRIPSKTRAKMMAACDAFVVLCRADYVLEGWRTALAEHGLEDRIAAVVTTAEPEGPFACESMGFDECGVFHAGIRGLDRKKDLAGAGIIGELARAFAPFVRHLSFMPVVASARAAVAQAFLTKDGGTRYGAAARSAVTGKIYTAGQYASWNHTTNIHAEMSALSQAAAAGDPDVDVLVVACSKAESASPCGVCRQVMSEHARRTGRDFDVVLAASGRNYHSIPVSGLMTEGWAPHLRKHADAGSRSIPDVDSLFSESGPQTGGEFLDSRSPRRICFVWDAAFRPGEMLVKPKYEEVDSGRFSKLPHAFTEASSYRKYLVDSHLGAIDCAGGMLVPSAGLRFANPKRSSDPVVGEVSKRLFIPAGIGDDCVRIMCSRALGMHRPGSDYDLAVLATPGQISEFRKMTAQALATGAISIPAGSKSWKLLCAQYPSASDDGGLCLVNEGRYAETFRFGNDRISVMFVNPDDKTAALPKDAVSCGFTSLCGTVEDATRACYKRSEALVRVRGDRLVRLLSYVKTANLLKVGDVVSLSGILWCHAEEADGAYSETLLQLSAATDKIVWMR